MGKARHHLSIRIPIPSELPAQTVVDALQRHSPMIRHQALVTRFQRRPVALSSVVDDSFFLADGHRIAQFDVYERITFVPGVAHKEISFPVVFQSVKDGVRCRADAPAGVRLWSEYRVERRTVGAGAATDSKIKSKSKSKAGTADAGTTGAAANVANQLVNPSRTQTGLDAVATPASTQAYLSAPHARHQPFPRPAGATGLQAPGQLAGADDHGHDQDGEEVYDLVEEIVAEANSILMPFIAKSMEAAHRDLCAKVLDEVAKQMRERPRSAQSTSW